MNPYNDRILEHLNHPRNEGVLDDHLANVGVAHLNSVATGRMIDLYVEVQNDRISSIRFKAHGCGYTIATMSWLTALCENIALESAMQITSQQLVNDLDLPSNRIHCAVMAEDALKTAIRDYQHKKKTYSRGESHVTHS